jgi:hypothetical protein
LEIKNIPENYSFKNKGESMLKLILLIGLIFTLHAVWGSPIVPLTVKERSGIDRINEPVLSGVPLPESLYTDTSVFALKDDAGNVVPCEFRTAAKWWRDKQSIRWLHLDFQTSMTANQEKTFVLHNEPASHPVTGSKLNITDLGTKYQVTTGPLRFTVKKQGFNLFDEVWIDESGGSQFDAAHQIVNSHTKGFSLLSSGVRYYSSNDNAITASIEREGPMAAVIKLEGRLKNSAGTQRYYFLARIYAYNNSKIVKVVFSWEYRDSDVSATIPMHGLNLEVPLNLSARNFMLGAKSAPQTGTLTASDEAFLYIGKIDAYAYGGLATGSGNTRYDQSLDMGIASLSDGQKGAAVSTKWFWQNYPASVEMNGSGLINIGLFSHRFTGGATTYPPRQTNHYRIHSGMSKTHEIRFVFFNDDNNAEIKSQLVGVNSRLYAVTPAVWYCRGTRAFGDLVERGNPSLYTVARWNQLLPYETALYNGALKCLGNTNATVGGKDAYDYLGWGDNPHYAYAPGQLMWNGNYYDLPHMILQLFLRTVDYRFLEYVDAHTAHIQDLHTVHFEPNNPNDGGNRYCPPMNHVGADNVAPNVQDHTSHHKTQSLFEKYQLLGDDRALDVAYKGLKRVKSQGTSMTGDVTTYLRRPAHVLFTETTAYKHGLASADYTAMVTFYNALRDRLAVTSRPGSNWQVGLATEAMIDVYEITGNSEILQIVKNTNDKVSNLNACAAFGLAYISHHLNVVSDFNRITSAMSDFGNGVSFGHHEKDFAEKGHGLNRLSYYYAIPDSAANKNVDLGLTIDAKVSTEAAGHMIKAFPNPFRPFTVIQYKIPGNRTGAERAIIEIFDVNGKKIKSLVDEAKTPGVYSIKWDGKTAWNRRAAAGVYLVRMQSGSNVKERKILLIK